jgi:uncharacterized RDD family membrane protein YckC
MRTGALQIRTVEGVVFSQPLAGPVTRCLAWSVDLLCIGLLMWTAGWLSMLVGILSWNFAGAFSTLLYFVISIGYGIACEWNWRGQTVGKLLLNTQIVDDRNQILDFWPLIFKRYFPLWLVAGIPFIGGIFALANALAIFRACSGCCSRSTPAGTRCPPARSARRPPATGSS